MSEDVVIKSMTHGITLVMNKDIPIDQLLISICEKFAKAKKFFGKATLALSLEGRDLSPEETEAVIQCIERNSDITISLIVSKDKVFEKEMSRKKDAFYFRKSADYLKIHNGNIEGGQKIISNYGLLVTGDIEEGGIAECGGSMVVLGTIRGRASAGRQIGKTAYIVASAIEEADISIASVRDNFSIKKKKKILSDKNEMITVTIDNGTLKASQFSGSIDVS